MINESTLQSDVMLRVKTVRHLRFFLASPFVALLVIVGLSVWAEAIVSFHDIMKNTMAHESWISCLSYIYSSFINSRFVVQIVAGLMTVSGIFLFITLLKNVKKINPLRLYNFGLRG